MRKHRLAPVALALTASALTLAPREASADVFYYGGRVLANAEVVEVSWTAQVDTNYLQQLGGFYQAIVQSPFMDWMSEYDTLGQKGYVDGLAGSAQHIGRGTFGGSFTIVPGNASTSLSDQDIQNELIAQLDQGKLPMPKLDAGGNVNTIYMIDFPPGTSISLLNLTSCSSFGAYHFTVTYKGMSVPYGVHPACGYSFDQATSVHSHELAEAMTDMEVGLVPPNGPTIRPTGWVTLAPTSWDTQEISDLCVGQQDNIAGYNVQKSWSNFAQGCVAQIPVCDGSTMPPQCRNCNAFDIGNACGGAKPACATGGPEVGHCVLCTAAFTAACTGATPACDDATYTCVGCVKNDDCKAPGAPVCELTTKTCRPCKADAECSNGVCDVQSDAEAGQCVPCNVDHDCKAPGDLCQAHACVSPSTSGTGGASATTTSTGAGQVASVSAGAGGGAGAGAGGNDANANGVVGNGCSCEAPGEGPREPASWALLVGLAAIARARRKSG